MMRAIFSKVMWLMRGMLWLGRGTATVLGLAVMLALVVGLASTALAANGQPFLLGKLTNAATATTRLVGNVAAGPALQVINPNTAASARGLDVLVASGKPPIYVSPSAGKALNLDADKVDGNDSTALLPGGDLPRGRTVRGSYAIRFDPVAAGRQASESISFGYTLASEPTSVFVPSGSAAPSSCPGTVSNPQAAPGFLCVYEGSNVGTTNTVLCNPAGNFCGGSVSRFGGYLRTDSTGTGTSTRTVGTWAVTGS